MGMLESSSLGYYDRPNKQPQQCKRDYETEIKREREQLAKITNLIDAIWDFVGHGQLRDKMAELIGELISWQRLSAHTIEILIGEQERENSD